MAECLGVCAVLSGTEQQVRQDIERAGFGTRVPSYRTSFHWRGKQHVRLRALFPGYVFTYLTDGWGMLNDIEGVRPIYRAGRFSRCSEADSERLAQLERHCLLGDFNRAQLRNAAGRFERKKHRRRRPRPGKRLRSAA